MHYYKSLVVVLPLSFILSITSKNYSLSNPINSKIAFSSHNNNNNNNKNEIDLGTTILAIKYKDGIIVASDTRSSSSGYVSNRFSNKISFVIEDDDADSLYDGDDNDTQQEQKRRRKTTCCICRSGSAADTQYIIDTTREVLLERSMYDNNHLSQTTSSIRNVAYILRNVLQTLRRRRNSISSTLICTGYDAVQNKPVLYTLNSCGTLLEQTQQNWVAFGSGSTFIIGFLEELCSSSGTDNMEEEKVIEIVRRALELAIDNDGKSGSGVLIYALDQFGKRRIML